MLVVHISAIVRYASVIQTTPLISSNFLDDVLGMHGQSAVNDLQFVGEYYFTGCTSSTRRNQESQIAEGEVRGVGRGKRSPHQLLTRKVHGIDCVSRTDAIPRISQGAAPII